MKTTAISLAVIALAASCSTGSNTVKYPAPEGEWDIVSAGGSTLDTGKTDEKPFLGFDKATHNLYGSAGCNSITGTFKADTRRHTLNLGSMGTTMMLCADMDTEQRVLESLGKVTAFAYDSEGNLMLLDGKGSTALQLRPRGK